MWWEHGLEEEEFSEPEPGSRPLARPKEGEYVRSDFVHGVYTWGGIAFNPNEQEHWDMYDEWKDKLKRDSIAKSSLIKIWEISSGTYFTKGKLAELGLYVKEKGVDVVFVNAQLTPMQIWKLEK